MPFKLHSYAVRLWFSVEISAERYFKIPHFLVPSRALFSQFLFFFSFSFHLYFLLKFIFSVNLYLLLFIVFLNVQKNCPKQPNTGCHPRFSLPLVAKAHLLINTPAITARKDGSSHNHKTCAQHISKHTESQHKP